MRRQEAESLVRALHDVSLGSVLAAAALGDGPEVVAMGFGVEAVFAAVAVLVVGSSQDGDILRAGSFRVLLYPVLGRHVLVLEDDTGDARDGVVARGDAVGLARLLRQELGRGIVADARGAEGVLAKVLACW